MWILKDPDALDPRDAIINSEQILRPGKMVENTIVVPVCMQQLPAM